MDETLSLLLALTTRQVRLWWQAQTEHEFWPRMPCSWRCRHEMKRPHWSCLYCRTRRWFAGKLSSKIWHWNRYFGMPIPSDVKPDVIFLNEAESYIIYRDPQRRFLVVKDILFLRLFKVCEQFEMKNGEVYPKAFFFVRKNLFTLLETLAN